MAIKSTQSIDYLSKFFLINYSKYCSVKDNIEKICITKNERTIIGNRTYLDIKIDFVINKDFNIDENSLHSIIYDWENELSVYVGQFEYDHRRSGAVNSIESDYHNIVKLFNEFAGDKVSVKKPNEDDVTIHIKSLAYSLKNFSIWD